MPLNLKKNEYVFTAEQIHQVGIEPSTKREEATYQVKLILNSQKKVWLGFGTSSFDEATHLVSTLEKLFRNILSA